MAPFGGAKGAAASADYSPPRYFPDSAAAALVAARARSHAPTCHGCVMWMRAPRGGRGETHARPRRFLLALGIGRSAKLGLIYDFLARQSWAEKAAANLLDFDVGDAAARAWA